jgi:hypothetical protein
VAADLESGILEAVVAAFISEQIRERPGFGGGRFFGGLLLVVGPFVGGLLRSRRRFFGGPFLFIGPERRGRNLVLDLLNLIRILRNV